MDGFLNLIIEVWNQDFLGISIGNVVISLIIIVTSLILRALIISRVFKFLENLAKETETEADDILLETLERPIGNVPLALGLYLIIELLPLSGIADVFLTNTVKALIAYTIFSVLTKAIGPIFELLAIKSWVTAALSMWLERFTRVLVWILAIAIILDIFGVEIGPIIAGLGLFSVAVALGAQDLFKNLISGILIIAENRFQPGDRIEVDGKLQVEIETPVVLGSGDYFGETGLISQAERNATISVLEEAKLLKLSKESLDELTEEYPALFEDLQRSAADRTG